MASVRRGVSPANHIDIDIPLSTPPSPEKPQHHPNSNSLRFLFFTNLLSYTYTRKSLSHISLFFLFGFLFGLLPFSYIDHSTPLPQPQLLNPVHLQQQYDIVVPPPNKRLLIIVTPTYNRVLQAYYLNRLGQLIKLIEPPVLWIVVEMGSQSGETAEILRNLGVMYRHLVCKKRMSDVKDRGVHQRNTALQHIELHKLDGIVYFADDDNVYSVDLFDRVRGIRRFGTWPVAMLSQSKNKAVLEGPVCSGSQVIGWHTNEKSKRLRRFHVDMSGFAFNSTILWDPKRWKRPFLTPIRQLDTIKEGFQETTFIEQVVAEESQMEGVPDDCRYIMNWHLHLDAHGVAYPRGWFLQRNLDAVLPIS